MFSFRPTDLASTRFPADESEWPRGSSRRFLFGQALLCRPYHMPPPPRAASNSSNPIVQTQEAEASGGRFLDESILESVYRRRGDGPIDALLELREREGRPIGDAEDLMALAIQLEESSSSALSTESNTEPKRHIALSEADQALVDFYTRYSEVPSWFDEPQIQRGQDVFCAYAPSIGASLFYRSLVPGFSIPKIAQVLLSTGYLAPPATESHVTKRLLDTGAFVAAVASSPHAIAPHSDAWIMALQVRILHAKVRRRLLQRGGRRPTQNGTVHSNGVDANNGDEPNSFRKPGDTSVAPRAWSIVEYGIPINQEDLAATLLGFSYNAMMGSEMILGQPWSVPERLDFLAFWRNIGWLLGIECLSGYETELFSSVDETKSPDATTWPPLDPCGPGWYPDDHDPLAHAYAMFGSILLHLTQPDATSVQIAHHLLRLGRPPSHISDDIPKSEKLRITDQGSSNSNEWFFFFRCYQCRRFAGHDLANALLLPYHPSWYRRLQISVLSTCYLWILRLYSWAASSRSPMRSTIVRFHRTQFHKLVAHWRKPPEAETIDGGPQKTNGSSVCSYAMVLPPRYE